MTYRSNVYFKQVKNVYFKNKINAVISTSGEIFSRRLKKISPDVEMTRILSDNSQIYPVQSIYNYHQKSPEALSAYQNALSFFERMERTQGKKRQAQVYYNTVILWHEGFGNHQKALEALLKALKIDDEIKHFSGASKCCIKIARIFQSQDNKTATLVTTYTGSVSYTKQDGTIIANQSTGKAILTKSGSTYTLSFSDGIPTTLSGLKFSTANGAYATIGTDGSVTSVT